MTDPTTVTASSSAASPCTASPSSPTALTTTIPTYVVDLDVDPTMRWHHVIADYVDHMKCVEAIVDSHIESVRGAGVAASIISGILKGALKMNLVYYKDELTAIAKQSGMPLGKLIIMQLIYEAVANCTSVITPAKIDDDADGGGSNDAKKEVLAHIRTMDWEMEFLRPLTINVQFVKNQGTPVAMVTTWAGYVGVLTGMSLGRHQSKKEQEGPQSRRDDGNNGNGEDHDDFSIAVNFRNCGTGTFWDNVKQAVGKAWPIGFLVREVLTDPSAGYYKAKEHLKNSLLIAPCYLTICSSCNMEACLITRDRGDKHDQMWEYQERGPIVQTNMDHWSDKWEDSILYSRERRRVVRREIERRQGRHSNNNKFTVPELWALMSQKPVYNAITIYGTLMIPSLAPRHHHPHPPVPRTTTTCVESRVAPSSTRTGFLPPSSCYESKLPFPYVGFKPFPQSRKVPLSPEEHPDVATCDNCGENYHPGLNAPGRCLHVDKWHASYDDCKIIACGFNLGVRNIGKPHWGCCYSTDYNNTVCRMSPPHEMNRGRKRKAHD